jgi:hypothetical protein
VIGRRFDVVGYGYDDITVYFDLSGSKSLGRIEEMPGRVSGTKKVLGSEASWGKFEPLLGRSYSFYMAQTRRLYVQWKPAQPGELLKPAEFEQSFKHLTHRLAVVGLESFVDPCCTRLDVAVDLACYPEDGKLLLDALHAARLPKGQRIDSAGQPRSTIYFRPRASNDILARAYCRNLKTGDGLPFGKIRLEAVNRFDPGEWPTRYCENGNVAAAMLWESRYGNTQVDGRISRIRREDQMVTLTQKARLGEMSVGEFERMNSFLDAERLGIAREVYGDRLYAERRREARKLGLSVNDAGEEPVDLDIGELLQPAREVWAA